MDLQSAVRKTGLTRTDLGPGYVCLVRDGLIRMPDNEASRTVHFYRHVLIFSNDYICTAPECILVTIAPFSTELGWKKPEEIIIENTKSNGLSQKSRLMLGHLQPMHKTDIEKKLGELNLDDWEKVMIQVVKNFDRG